MKKASEVVRLMRKTFHFFLAFMFVSSMVVLPEGVVGVSDLCADVEVVSNVGPANSAVAHGA